MTAFWILGDAAGRERGLHRDAEEPGLQRRRFACSTSWRSPCIVPDARRGISGGHSDRRLQRRDPDAVRLRHRAALERDGTVRAKGRTACRSRAGRRLCVVLLAFAALGYAALREPLVPVTASRQFVARAGRTSRRLRQQSPTSAAALFTTHLLPFEVTAFILMVAVIGVVLLAGGRRSPAHARTSRRRGRRASASRSSRSDEHRRVDAYVALSAVIFFIGVLGVHRCAAIR